MPGAVYGVSCDGFSKEWPSTGIHEAGGTATHAQGNRTPGSLRFDLARGPPFELPPFLEHSGGVPALVLSR
jgi:hypothetical protein